MLGPNQACLLIGRLLSTAHLAPDRVRWSNRIDASAGAWTGARRLSVRRWARLLLAALAIGSLWLAAGAPAQTELHPRCGNLVRPDRRGRFVARADMLRPAGHVDGDDLLALVNRTPLGALPHDYAPADLVDLATLRPARPHQCVPPQRQCLRAEAARAYREFEAAMRAAGERPYVSSAFRAYHVQCATFSSWAQRERDGFCAAATASALPGHSQHQLGTAVDLFTRDWMDGGDRFREGFGCTSGARWMAAHAHEHGFVIPYPLHPDYRREGSDCAAPRGEEGRIDPRTGYRYEPWHLRYVGVENAQRFHRAWLASGPGTPSEITLEQWLRAERGSRTRPTPRSATAATAIAAPPSLAAPAVTIEARPAARPRSASTARADRFRRRERRASSRPRSRARASASCYTRGCSCPRTR
ncbi:MAG: M15 family metallopeptidase [Sandaracinaceae bacterium]|nr:M15 family metallopeptidase [Sandaracinaceae bacterium]